MNWENTWNFEHTEFPLGKHSCRVTFNNSTCFQSIDGMVYNHLSWDGFYVDYGERWKGQLAQFEGNIHFHWEGLAKKLEARLTSEFDIPNEGVSPEWHLV